jgi:hypothetical protein
MDIFAVLESYGVPICVAVAFGFFIWKQNKFIQDELMEELDERFKREEGILIKLIDQSKISQLEQKEIKASFHAIVEILTSLSGNGLKEKFGRKNDRSW